MLRESLRGQRCIGATIRQETLLPGVIILNEESPFLTELDDLTEYRKPTNISMPFCIEMMYGQEVSFCVEVDQTDLEREKHGLLERILAY